MSDDESDIKNHEARIASLKEEVRRYYALLSQMNDGFGIINESNKFTFVNKRFATMIGYTEDEMLGHELTEFMDDKNKEIVKEQIKTRTRGQSSQYELEWTSRNGVVVPTIVSGAPLLDEKGKHCGSFAVITDITELRQAQHALQESEEMLSSVVDHTHTGVCILNDKYQIIYANDEMSRISGRTREEMIGQDFRQFLTDESKADIIERYERRQKGEDIPERYDAFFIHKDDSKRLIEVIATSTKDSSGRAKSIAQVLDVTEQRKAEKALRESEARYRLLAENVKEIIFTMDMSFHFTFVTPSVEEVLGYTPEEMMNQSLTELMTPKSIGVTVDAFSKALAEEEKPETEREHGQSLELELLNKNGDTIIFEVSRTFLRDSQGKPVGILGVARDIRARKEAEYALQESEERYRSLIEALPDAVVLTDLDGKILYVNKPAMFMFSIDDENSILGINILDLISPDDRQRALQVTNKTIEIGNIRRVEYSFERVDGTSFPGEYSASVVVGRDAEPIAFIGVIEDITDRKLVERQLRSEKDRALLYLDLMGHDIRNQLQVILGVVQTTRTLMQKDDGVSHTLQLVDSAVERCQGIISKVKAAERLTTVPLTQVSLREVLIECLSQFQRRFEDAIVSTDIVDADAFVMADEFIYATIMSLLVNAVEHNPKEERHVWVRLRESVGGYEITISDDGSAIQDKQKTNLFDTQRRFGGVSLHLTKHALEKYSGTMKVYDRVPGEPEKGAEFLIWLPKTNTAS